MSMVSRLLGRRYSLTGTVISGAGRGRNFGFPTANVMPDYQDKIVPGNGTYAASVSFKDGTVYYGMLNIGFNPTFEGKKRSIEINIFDFNSDIYGEIVTLEFYEKIRDEMKFDSAESLAEQLRRDEIKIREIISNAER